jgi:histidinol dehydrogenase
MTEIKRLDSSDAAFQEQLEHLLDWEQSADLKVESVVREIITAVRTRGDAALIEYTERFDRRKVADGLEIALEKCRAALDVIEPEQRSALELAAQRVRAYAEHQRLESWSYTEDDGTLLGQQVMPMDRVGLYVPGGKAAYPSSVLMNAIPAKVAVCLPLAGRRPLPRWHTEPKACRQWTRSSGRAMPMSPVPNAWCSARSVST